MYYFFLLCIPWQEFSKPTFSDKIMDVRQFSDVEKLQIFAETVFAQKSETLRSVYTAFATFLKKRKCEVGCGTRMWRKL